MVTHTVSAQSYNLLCEFNSTYRSTYVIVPIFLDQLQLFEFTLPISTWSLLDHLVGSHSGRHLPHPIDIVSSIQSNKL